MEKTPKHPCRTQGGSETHRGRLQLLASKLQSGEQGKLERSLSPATAQTHSRVRNTNSYWHQSSPLTIRGRGAALRVY
eukprot:3489827-Pyramimonas_sp.AAC.1